MKSGFVVAKGDPNNFGSFKINEDPASLLTQTKSLTMEEDSMNVDEANKN